MAWDYNINVSALTWINMMLILKKGRWKRYGKNLNARFNFHLHIKLLSPSCYHDTRGFTVPLQGPWVFTGSRPPLGSRSHVGLQENWAPQRSALSLWWPLTSIPVLLYLSSSLFPPTVTKPRIALKLLLLKSGTHITMNMAMLTLIHVLTQIPEDLTNKLLPISSLSNLSFNDSTEWNAQLLKPKFPGQYVNHIRIPLTRLHFPTKFTFRSISQ